MKVSKGSMRRERERRERRNEGRTLLGLSKSGNDSDVGLDDTLTKQSNVLDELERRLNRNKKRG